MYCTVLYCTVLYLVESIDSAPPLVKLGEDHSVEAEHHSDGQENRDGGGQLHLLQQQQTVKMKLLYIHKGSFVLLGLLIPRQVVCWLPIGPL